LPEALFEPITIHIQDKYILDITGKSGRPKDLSLAGGWVSLSPAGITFSGKAISRIVGIADKSAGIGNNLRLPSE